ncbi:type I restriction enzyme endonuclease domain-containing protein [Anaerofustis stercorihominis]|uniref:type I restriction enzyme endonuclease domain-containing protein n=1 Tax=Anaerofustis stercorihominis TaxID=214853 RepID=UPI00214C2DC6|nr:type I restriction enzyme endonuclease domain-containing protein [Anaerofustis stercorihominis]MCR2032775.1 DUF3387 domain-containing protein [Anaerofustis stercorihominis]
MSSQQGLDKFINIIQTNYMVIPTYTNERLIKQNGVFLLTSFFSVNINEEIGNSIINKTKGSLKNQFSEQYFFIKGDNKEEILKELDLYNINEATLFPELEHQLNYIRDINEENTQFVASFIKYEKAENDNKSYIYANSNDTELNDYIIENIEKILKNIVEKKDIRDIKNIIQNNFTVDWYCKESIQSKIKIKIKEFYKKNYPDTIKLSEQAEAILEAIITEVKNFYNNRLND